MDRRGPRAPGPRRRWTWGRKRVLAAAAVLVALITVAAVGSFTAFLRVCDVPGGPDAMCRPLELTDPVVVLGVLLALGFLLPDIHTFRLGADGVEFERDTVGEDEDLSARIELVERKIELYREQLREGEDR